MKSLYIGTILRCVFQSWGFCSIQLSTGKTSVHSKKKWNFSMQYASMAGWVLKDYHWRIAWTKSILFWVFHFSCCWVKINEAKFTSGISKLFHSFNLVMWKWWFVLAMVRLNKVCFFMFLLFSKNYLPKIYFFLTAFDCLVMCNNH